MIRSKPHELYSEANNLLFELGTNARIIIPTNNDYRWNVNTEEDLFCSVYQKLSGTQQKGLEALLRKFIHTVMATKNNKINFELKEIEELNLAKNPGGYKFKAYFIDNLNGNTLFFIPTYKYASGIGKHEIVKPLNYTGGKVKDNSIVSNWAREDSKPRDISSFGFYRIPAYITLYAPPSYIEESGISIYVQDKKDLENKIKKFKSNFMEKLVISGRSPIVCKIENLLGKGYKLLKEETEKNKAIKIKKEIKNLKRKIF